MRILKFANALDSASAEAANTLVAMAVSSAHTDHTIGNDPVQVSALVKNRQVFYEGCPDACSS